MATLADINKTLKNQNKAQDETTKSVGSLTNNFKAWLTGQKVDKLKDLEAEREAKTQGRLRVSAIGDRAKSIGASGISGLENIAGTAASSVGGLISRVAGLIPAAFALIGSGTLISLLANGIKRRGIPALLANIFADRIGDAVQDFTGSSQVGDAVQRGLKLGSFGLLLGKRFALISAAIGALLTKENKEKVTELGEELLNTTKELNLLPKDATFESVLTSIQGGANKALTALTALVKGDFASKEFTDNWESLAVAAAGIFTLLNPFGTIGKMVTAVVLAYKALKGMGLMAAGVALGAAKGGVRFLGSGAAATAAAVKAIPSEAGPQVNAADLDQKDLELENKRRISNLNKKQLSKLSEAGYRVKDGVLQKLNAKGTSGAALNTINTDDILSRVAGADNKLLSASKIGNFARFIKLMKAVPFLGSVISIGQLSAIVADSAMSMDQKIEEIGQVFGAVLGGASGAGIGGLIGTGLGGPVLGTILGAAVGAFGGDFAGKAIAQYLMGKPIDAFPDWTGANDQLNGLLGLSANGKGQFTYSQAAMAQGMADATAFANDTQAQLASQVADYFYQNSGQYGGGAPVINAPQVDASVTTSPQAAIVKQNGATDRNDPVPR